MTVATTLDLQQRFTAMASTVTVRVIDPTADAEQAIARVEELFAEVERSCTRFDPTSDLMRANAQGDEWVAVAPACRDAIALARDAHHRTNGMFDPRVLRTLTSMGYDRSLNFARGDVTTAGTADGTAHRGAWEPGIDVVTPRVRVGVEPIDLGGIGKGFAVRCAIAELAEVGSGALVEAGGDLATFGLGPLREGTDARTWRAAVEDPRGGDVPIAVLDVTDCAAATSSVRLRRWHADGKLVHHLIDPRTGQSSAADLLAVTVVGDDPAWAEVWTKVCFLAGSEGIREVVETNGLHALWVDDQGRTACSDSLHERIVWEASQ